MTDKITFDEFIYILDEPITRLTNEIERVANERGVPMQRGIIREILEDAVEDIHIRTFVKKMGRKISKWFKKVFS